MPAARIFHRDDRRRRVLNDTVLGQSASKRKRTARPSASEPVEEGRSPNYGDAEFLDEMPRLVDFVPLRLPVYLVFLACAAGTIAGLVELFRWSPALARWTGIGEIAAFDLSGRGTIGSWLSSMLLMLAGILAVLVFSVRRHRRDDYHGHYRVWLWAALAWLLMSLDATAALRHDLGRLLAAASGTPLWRDGALWWMLLYGFFFGGIGVRLLVDMRHCRLSSGAFVLAAMLYLGAAALRLTAPGEDLLREAMLRHAAAIAGHAMLLLAMGLQARHVLLDAQGLLPVDEEEEDEEEESDEDEEEDAEEEDEEEEEDDEEEAEEDEEEEVPVVRRKPVKVHPPHAGPRSSASAAKSSGNGSAASNSSGLAPVSRKLTKQEKKALRERLARMREQRDGK